MGTVKNVTIEDIENLKKTADMYHRTQDELDRALASYERIKQHAPNIEAHLEQQRDKKRLEQLEKAFDKLPAEVKENLLPSQIQETEISRER
jgi:hypothetical protein